MPRATLPAPARAGSAPAWRPGLRPPAPSRTAVAAAARPSCSPWRHRAPAPAGTRAGGRALELSSSASWGYSERGPLARRRLLNSRPGLAGKVQGFRAENRGQGAPSAGFSADRSARSRSRAGDSKANVRDPVGLTSAAAHRIPAVQALVAGAVADGDVPAAVAHGGIAHHLFELRIERPAVALVIGRGQGRTFDLDGLGCDLERNQARNGRIFNRAGALRLRRLDLGAVVALQVLHAEHAEDVVDDRGRELDVRVTGDHPVRLEARERELLDELLERYAVLQTDRHRHREAVHQRAEGSPLLVHVDEDLAECAVLVLAGAQEHLVPADVGFLREASALLGQAHARAFGALQGDGLSLRDGSDLFFGRNRFVAVLAARRERLRGLATVAVQRDRLETELPALFVNLPHVVDGGFVGQVHGLADRAGQEGLGRRHHPHVRHRG